MDDSKSQELYKRWHEMSLQDFEMVKLAMTKNLLLQAAYHCQQSLEKELKGLYILFAKEQAIFSHDLLKIAADLKKFISITDETIKIFSALNPFYIQARYPSYKESVSQSLDSALITNFINTINKVYTWHEQKKT